MIGDIPFIPSILYTYFNARYIDNKKLRALALAEPTINRLFDDGCTLLSAYDAIIDYNIIDQNIYPFIFDNINQIPPKHIYKKALKDNINPIIKLRRIIPSLNSIKYALYVLKRSICFGCEIYNNFLNLSYYNDILYAPNPYHYMIGMHALLLIGYDDTCNTFIILNSAGTSFCSGGFFRMSYEYINFCDEFYIINP
jgi:hypothetical protein